MSNHANTPLEQDREFAEITRAASLQNLRDLRHSQAEDDAHSSVKRLLDKAQRNLEEVQRMQSLGAYLERASYFAMGSVFVVALQWALK